MLNVGTGEQSVARPNVPDILDHAAVALLLAVCTGLVIAFLAVSLGRMSYRFELEWLEGLTVDHAWRILHGRAIYAPPDGTFAPNMYPPLYYFASLPVLMLTGWSLLGARLVSWLSAVGGGVLTVHLLRRSAVSVSACALALGVEAAFYPVTLHWYDLARVDSLHTLLVVAGLALLASDGARPTRSRIWLGGLVLTFSLLTKQTSIFVCGATVAYFIAMHDWRRSLHVSAALILFGFIGATALLLWSPQALTFIIGMPAQHRLSLASGLGQMEDLGWRVAPLAVIALYPVFTRRSHTRPIAFFACNLLGALIVSFLTLFKVGGQTNSAMPAIFLLATAVGFGADEAWQAFGRTSGGRLLRAATATALAGFLVLTSGLDYRSAVPGSHDREVAEGMSRRLLN